MLQVRQRLVAVARQDHHSHDHFAKAFAHMAAQRGDFGDHFGIERLRGGGGGFRSNDAHRYIRDHVKPKDGAGVGQLSMLDANHRDEQMERNVSIVTIVSRNDC